MHHLRNSRLWLLPRLHGLMGSEVPLSLSHTHTHTLSLTHTHTHTHTHGLGSGHPQFDVPCCCRQRPRIRSVRGRSPVVPAHPPLQCRRCAALKLTSVIQGGDAACKGLQQLLAADVWLRDDGSHGRVGVFERGSQSMREKTPGTLRNTPNALCYVPFRFDVCVCVCVCGCVGASS